MDNAKAILIILVVLGHAIEDVPKDDLAAGLYRIVYLFHMPAFALITGYLSRRFRPSVGSYLKLIGALLVPYVIFQVGHAAIVGWMDGEPIKIDLLQPEWTMWYLVAVAFWRVLTPLFRALPLAVPVAILSAIGFGMLPDLPDVLALDRTITLLPFFVIGLTLTPEALDRVRRFGVVRLGVIFVPLAVGASWWSFGRLSHGDFWFNRSFAQLGDDWLATGLLLRLVSYGLGLLGTAWVLAIASRRKLPLTYVGVQSMYVYLLHSVILLPFKDGGVIAGPDEPWLLIMSVAFAIILAVVLASKPVTMITRLAVQPPFGAIKLPATKPDPSLQAGWARRAQIDDESMITTEIRPRRAAEPLSVRWEVSR